MDPKAMERLGMDWTIPSANPQKEMIVTKYSNILSILSNHRAGDEPQRGGKRAQHACLETTRDFCGGVNLVDWLSCWRCSCLAGEERSISGLPGPSRQGGGRHPYMPEQRQTACPGPFAHVPTLFYSALSRTVNPNPNRTVAHC